MRILIEQKCEGCIDGRVQTPNTYEDSTECARCNGTAIEQTSVEPEALLGALMIRVAQLEDRLEAFQNPRTLGGIRDQIRAFDNHVAQDLASQMAQYQEQSQEAQRQVNERYNRLQNLGTQQAHLGAQHAAQQQRGGLGALWREEIFRADEALRRRLGLCSKCKGLGCNGC